MVNTWNLDGATFENATTVASALLYMPIEEPWDPWLY